MSCATLSEAISAIRVASASGASSRTSCVRAGSVMDRFTCTVETLCSYEVGHLVRDEVANGLSGGRPAANHRGRDVDPRHLEKAHAIGAGHAADRDRDRIPGAAPALEDTDRR